MNCEKCGKLLLEHLDYCPSCKFQEEFGEMTSAKIQKKPPITGNPRSVKNDKLEILVCQCGQKLESNWRFCPKCNTPTETIHTINSNNTINDMKTADDTNTINSETEDDKETPSVVTLHEIIQNTLRRTGIKNPFAVNSDTDVPPSNSNPKIYITIFCVSLCLGFFLPYISLLLDFHFSGPFFLFCFLIALITIITGKIKCPEDKTIKDLFYISLVVLTIYAIYIHTIMSLCGISASSAISSCGSC